MLLLYLEDSPRVPTQQINHVPKYLDRLGKYRLAVQQSEFKTEMVRKIQDTYEV